MSAKPLKRRSEPFWMLFFALALLIWTLIGICLPQPRSGEPVAVLTAAGDPHNVLVRLLNTDADAALLNIYAEGRVIVVYPSQLNKLHEALRGTPSIAVDAAFVGCSS